MALLVGRGCVGRSANFGADHNPSPRTERGKRRHAKRSGEQKKHAEAMWSKNRVVEVGRKWARRKNTTT